MNPSNPRAVLAALSLLAFPSLADEAYELPRAQADHAVRAVVECLDADACEVSQLCRTPAEWTPDVLPEHYEHLESVGSGSVYLGPWQDDPETACAVHVAGAANVRALVEHRDVSMNALSRETVAIQRAGSVLMIDRRPGEDGIAAGWGDCRPATYTNYCPDAKHLSAASCDEEAAWHAYIEGSQRNDAVETLARDGIDEGTVVHLRAQRAHFATGDRNYGRNHWRASAGRLHNRTPAAYPDDRWSTVLYRAPRVVADMTAKLTVTSESEGQCSTTSIVFTVLDTD